MIYPRLAALPGDEANFVRFRRLLAVKVMTPFVLEGGIYVRPEITPTFFIAILVMAVALTRRWWRLGMLAVLAFSLWECIASWPFTLNHIAMEAAVLILILLDSPPRTGENRLAPWTKIQVLMLSVWFYSGVQKLLHGYFASGETLALEMLSGDSFLGRNLAIFYHYGLEPIFGAAEPPWLSCCHAGPIPLPLAIRLVFPIRGIATIATEIGLPWLVLFDRWRALALGLLFAFQLSVGIFSWELDFAVTAFAILLLFTPRYGRIGYPLLLIFYLGVSPWA